MPKLLAINVGAPTVLPGSATPTGIMKLPRTGPEFGKLIGLMVVMLKSLKAIRRR